MERAPSPVLHAIPVWVVSSNGGLSHETEAGLPAIALLDFRGIYSKWQIVLDRLRANANGSVNVIVADSKRGNSDAFKWVEIVRDAVPTIAVIALINKDDEENLKAALEAGVSGFLPALSTLEQTTSAIIAAANGDIVVSPALWDELMNAGAILNHSHDLPRLTAREVDLLRLLVDGKSVKEIADQLSISYFTAETHVKNIRRKLGVKSIRAVVSIAMKEHLV